MSLLLPPVVVVVVVLLLLVVVLLVVVLVLPLLLSRLPRCTAGFVLWFAAATHESTTTCFLPALWCFIIKLVITLIWT